MLQMVVFDFDGIIVDTEPAHFEIFRQILAEEGIILTWGQYCARYLAFDDQEFFTQVLRDNGRKREKEKIAELMERKRANFAGYLAGNCFILPGVRELLFALRDEGIACSLCSGSFISEIEFVLQKGGIRDYFGIIVGAEDVKSCKPNPEGYRLIVRRANQQLEEGAKFAPGRCVAIEDSIGGIAAAKGAGLKCLAVTNSYPAAELGMADRVVKTLTEVDVAFLREIAAIKN